MTRTVATAVAALAIAHVSFGVPAEAKDQKAFIREAIQGNLAEIEMGKLAQQRSTNEGVKSFGRMLVDEHSAANTRAQAVARQLNVSPPSKPSLKQRATYAAQSIVRGASFDRRFVNHMISDHQKDIAAYRSQAQTGLEPTARMAKETLPTLEKHLVTAKSLQSNATAQKR
jgi:putative membrane protein